LKKQTGHSLIMAEGVSRAFRIRTGEDTPYTVEWAESWSAEQSPPPACLKGLTGPGCRVVQLLPNAEVSHLITALPSMKDKQMSAALLGIFQRDKGGTASDWVVAFTPLQGAEDAGQPQMRHDIAALFVRRPVRDHLYGKATELGVRPVAMMPGFLALDLLFRRHRPGEDPQGAWNLVYLGETERFICVGDEGGLLFCRPLPEDLSGGEEQEEYLERLAAEVERSNYFAQQTERSLNVQQVVVSGEPTLATALAERLGSFSGFEVDHWRAEELFAAPEGSVSWEQVISLAGAVASLERPGFDLLPDEAQNRVRRALKRHATLAAAALGAAVVPTLLVGGLWTVQVQKGFLEHAEEYLAQADSRLGEAALAYLDSRLLANRQQNVDEFTRYQPDLAGLLEEIASRTPDAVVFKELELSEDRTGRYLLTLIGESRARDGAGAQEVFLEFLAGLAECPRIEAETEQGRLEIGGVDEEGPPRSRVLFELKYVVTEGG